MDAPKVQYEEMEQKMCFWFSVSFLKTLFLLVKLYK